MKQLFILLLFCLLSCNNTSTVTIAEASETATKLSSPGVLVNSHVLEKQVFQKQIIANGKVAANQKSELRFKTTERIASIKVKNGQKAHKGQLLATLDNDLLANKLDKAKLDVAKANSKLQEEKINYSISDKITPTVLKELHIKSGYLEAKNALENAQLLYNQTMLKAPFDGVVANIETKTGNYITGSDIFCVLIGQQQLEVVFSVLENEMSFIEHNQKVEITSFVDSNKKYHGSITEINPLVDENGLIQLKATIDNSANFLLDGMHVKITINKPLASSIVIPKEALVLRSNKEVVFTVENSLAKWNYVEVLDENSTSYAIKKGLKLRDTIITSGNMNLSHDAKVNSTLAL